MTNNPKQTVQLFIKVFVWTIFFSFLAISTAPLMAQTTADTTTNTRVSKSISFANTTVVDASKKEILFQQNPLDTKPALLKQGYRKEANIMAALTVNNDYPTTNDISLFDASTELISDLNADGFYHRFSITIDADTVYDTAYVYAKLYLSLEGGPWNEYASSDIYQLHKDSTQDSFTIETELADGFPPAYYDVRIELYDADTDQWLLNYGPYDDQSLSALPLEDSTYDNSDAAAIYPPETNLVVAGQGAMDYWLLLVFVIILLVCRAPGFRAECH